MVDKSVAVQSEPVEVTAKAVLPLMIEMTVADPDTATLPWRLRPVMLRLAIGVAEVRSEVVTEYGVLATVERLRWPVVDTQSTTRELPVMETPGATLATPDDTTVVELMLLERAR